MIFDANLVFWGTSPYGSASNFQSLATLTGSSASNAINLVVAEDMGIGDGMAIPKLACYIGTAITSASTAMTLNLQFQGSTDNSAWTTYAESGALSTASFTGGPIFPIDIPKRPSGSALPQYYRLNLSMASNGTASISAGTILAGIVLQRADSDNTLGQYNSGFSVS
jgi:hypothetical protein